MSQADEQEQEQFEEESSAPPPRTGPLVRPVYVLVLAVLVLGGGVFALTGPACNMKDPGRDLRDLAQPQIMEQAINRFKDIPTLVAFTDTTHVLAKPLPVNPATSGMMVNSVLGVKKVGETSEVITHHAGNGFIAYKLRLPDGACGYVFSTDPIRLTSR
ncbi:MAG: hypothetical protein A3H49_03555 [Nitrospirae bacterium RIFCSPLOWO2_02_FULL_62_14]|nr:MAG: hypothetical protein A3H49_03555 [Nitrospirae bacterium RIFCSPLOWO2_02_FULL_62_14]OGW67625.1 MAG: hypothetical protein A3A88_04455 [Nitrospirae bacterium RIFCSPLOWO2_01_FULL_62_17]OGW92635.1 MAG: hypothetical protein A3K11_02275 [Nitrospirae bacterium RIFCSPLOWO2_12_FULL_63_8]